MKLDKSEFNTWFDYYFSLFPFETETYTGILKAVLLTAGLIYFVCLIISLIGHFLSLYIKVVDIYIGIFGISWVMFWLRWGTFRLFGILNKFPYSKKFFDNHKQRFSIEKTLYVMFNNKLIMFIFLFLMTMVSFVILQWYHQVPFLSHYFLTYPVAGLPKEWFMPNSIFLKEFILFLIVSLAILLVSTSGVQIFLYSVRIIPILSKSFDYKFPPFFLEELSPITSFNLEIAVSWYVGILIVIYVSYNSIQSSLVTDLFLLLLFSVDFIVFLLPQIVFHISMEEAKSNALKNLYKIYKNISLNLQEISVNLKNNDLSNLTKVKELVYLYEKINKADTWIIDFYQLIKLMLLLIPPLILVLHPLRLRESILLAVSLLLPVLIK